MLTHNILYTSLSKRVMFEVKYIIENNLYYDWAISIEYTYDAVSMYTKWNRWGNTYYKITNTSGIIDTIFSCHASNPLSTIRIHAKCYYPQASMIYLVYQPGILHKEDDELSCKIDYEKGK